MQKTKLFIAITLIAVVTTGCISFSSKKTAPEPIPSDGGFYVLGKNKDGDYIWTQKVYLATTSSQKPNFKYGDVLTMVKDPQDDQAIYIGAKKSGLYYTYDGGKNWFQPDKFKQNKINAIGISYKNKCLIYAATGPDLYKSDDCNRTWTKMYHDTRAGYYISALDIDSYNQGTVYIGVSKDVAKGETAEGDVVKSSDFAASWQVVHRMPSGSTVSRILINQKDTRVVYVATNNIGLYKTNDAGETWNNITGDAQDSDGDKLIDFTTDVKIKESLIFRDLVFVPDEDNSLIHASNYGLLRSNDGGNTWSEIELIPPEGDAKAIIYSLTVHPEDGQEFYYGTDNTLFKTTDGGVSWTTIRGPGTRAIYNIVVTPSNIGDANVYVGMYDLKAAAVKK